MKLEEMSEIDLKAMCYDQLVILEQTQINIKIIQQELQKRAEKPKEIVKEG